MYGQGNISYDDPGGSGGSGGGTVTGADNGLNLNATIVELGGPLIKNTAIDFHAFTLSFNNTGAQTAFDISSKINPSMISTDNLQPSQIFFYPPNYSVPSKQSRFSISLQEVNAGNPDGRDNVILNFASYNADPGGGPTISGEAAYRFAGESYFDIPGVGYGMEFHLPEVTLVNGTRFRPNSMYISRTTGNTNWDVECNSFAMSAAPGGATMLSYDFNIFDVIIGAQGGSFRIDSPSSDRYAITFDHGSNVVDITTTLALTQIHGATKFLGGISSTVDNASANFHVLGGYEVAGPGNVVLIFEPDGYVGPNAQLFATGTGAVPTTLNGTITDGGSNTTTWSLDARSGQPGFYVDVNGSFTTFNRDGSLSVLAGTISTVSSGAGSGKWALGKLVTAAVTPDATRYLEVKVDGVVLKLIIST